MSRLWVRIFTGMLLANAIAMVGVVLAYQPRVGDHRERIRARDASVIARVAELALDARDELGVAGATRVLDEARATTGLRVSVADARGNVILGDAEPAVAIAAVESAARDRVSVPLGPPYEFWQGVRVRDGWVAVGEPTQPEDVLGVSPPVMQLLVVALLAVFVSGLLARWTSGPLRTLREASQRLLAGPGEVRVAPGISRWADSEARALAQDFDRMAERIEGLLASRERLLRDVSHELRSPLARLNVALELARERVTDDAQPLLDRIQKESERLDELIGLVLSMAKLDQASRAVESTTFALDRLLIDVCDDAAFEAESVGRRVELISSTPCTIVGDEELLRQAIENVVRNGLRWTPEGTAVEVSSRREKHEDGPATILIEVRDHGPGVPDDALEEIFQPFARVDTARERSAGGVGLGLAITARALALHGGSASAQNVDGGGLRVTLELPLRHEGGGRA